MWTKYLQLHQIHPPLTMVFDGRVGADMFVVRQVGYRMENKTYQNLLIVSTIELHKKYILESEENQELFYICSIFPSKDILMARKTRYSNSRLLYAK